MFECDTFLSFFSLPDWRIFTRFYSPTSWIKRDFFLPHLTSFIEKCPPPKKNSSSWSGLCVPRKTNLWRVLRSACGLSRTSTLAEGQCWNKSPHIQYVGITTNSHTSLLKKKYFIKVAKHFHFFKGTIFFLNFFEAVGKPSGSQCSNSMHWNKKNKGS